MRTTIRFVGGDNLRGVPPSLRSAITDATAAAIDAHGEDPCTRRQAAAHEAGHAVVARAFGEMRNTRIRPGHRAGGRTRWVGSNHNHSKARVPFLVRANPDAAQQAAAIALAGFLGECLAGLSHPASSIDERGFAQLVCEELDDLRREPIGTHAERITVLVAGLLKRHRWQFDLLRERLAVHRMLSTREVASLLSEVQR